MAVNKNGLRPAAGIKSADQLRKIGLMVLFAGLALGGIIYLLGAEENSSEENTLMSQYYKNQELEAQRIWGNGGSLILGITRSFKRASTYSVLVIGISAIFAGTCFYLTRQPVGSGASNQGDSPSP